MCVYLFAPSRGQPLCFSLWVSKVYLFDSSFSPRLSLSLSLSLSISKFSNSFSFFLLSDIHEMMQKKKQLFYWTKDKSFLMNLLKWGDFFLPFVSYLIDPNLLYNLHPFILGIEREKVWAFRIFPLLLL